MQDFTGKVVFITGATSGIGEDVALQFAKQGAKVAFTGRRAEQGEAVAAKIKALGADAIFIRSDVKESADIEKAIKLTVEKFGRIDIAVNNAGVEEPMVPFLEQKVEKFDEIFDINVRGMWLCLQGEIRQMVKQDSECSIINISSIAGQSGFPQTSSYTASKHAVNGLTRVLASEFASKKIRINAVAPGPIRTEMWDRFANSTPGMEQMMLQMVPMGRVGNTAEVSSCVLWLASGTSTYVTGQIIVVDGGTINV
ncbi:MAG: glucose 1-dehydrogenase [Candidatus Obscuribacterales bacterium]|nr:glucose 1-dehydrogenase [Candidatus Obscuribacterales bacterium]